MTERDLVDACALAAVGEVAYRRTDGTVGVEPVVPLVLDGAPALALPFARTGLARQLAAAREAALSLTDSRLAYKGWVPLGATGAVAVDEDPEGVRFQESGMMGQELRKHPPSRLLIDTPVLRREYWWYLPRWVVRWMAVDRVRSVGRRRGPDDAVLAYAAAGSVDVDTVAVDDWEADEVRVSSLAGRRLDEVAAPAALHRHDFSVPDLDRWVSLTVGGRFARGRLRVETRDGDAAVPPPRRLLGRLRALRELERACRREIEG